MKTYYGRRLSDGTCHVTVEETKDGTTRRRPLGLRLDLWNHSPTGFEWGYAGSGPAQLALAILANALVSRANARDADELAVQLHQRFKSRVIARLDRADPWSLTQAAVLAHVDELAKSLAPKG